MDLGVGDLATGVILVVAVIGAPVVWMQPPTGRIP
jgi:hypothetical protein